MPSTQQSPPEKAIMVAVTPESFAANGLKRDSQVLAKYNPPGMAVPRSSFMKGNGHKNRVQYQDKGKME